jgi:RHS repeat-associated protein
MTLSAAYETTTRFLPSSSTGKERDTESGNDYFGARYYGSSMGRFMSPDEPFADFDPDNPQSWNLYGYVRNNPMTNTDPDGNDCVTQTRNSSTTETVTVNSGSCSGNVGDGQSQTYVNGTVTGVGRWPGHKITKNRCAPFIHSFIVDEWETSNPVFF